MTSRTHDNFRHNFWTWVDPPLPFEQCSKKLHFFETKASLIEMSVQQLEFSKQVGFDFGITHEGTDHWWPARVAISRNFSISVLILDLEQFQCFFIEHNERIIIRPRVIVVFCFCLLLVNPLNIAKGTTDPRVEFCLSNCFMVPPKFNSKIFTKLQFHNID